MNFGKTYNGGLTIYNAFNVVLILSNVLGGIPNKRVHFGFVSSLY